MLEHLGSAALVVESGHGCTAGTPLRGVKVPARGPGDRPGVWTAAVLRMLDTLPTPTLRR